MAVENFQMLQSRQNTDTIVAPDDKEHRVNLLNWDGRGAPKGMFPAEDAEAETADGSAGEGDAVGGSAGQREVTS